jgi:hypothetical protein
MTAGAEPFVVRKRRSAPRPIPAEDLKPLSAPPDGALDAPRVVVPARRRIRRPGLRVWTTLTQSIAALVCWGALAGIVYALNPEDSTARIAFFGVLGGAIFFTLTPIIRGITLQFAHSRLYQATVGFHAARQALMISIFITGNLFLQMNRAWNGLMALLLLGAFIVVEIVLLARR